MKRSCFIFGIASTIAAGSALVACGSSVICEGTACGGGAMASGASGAGGAGSAVSGSTTSTGAGGPGSVVLFGSDPLTLRFTSFPVTCSNPDQNAPFSQCGWYTLEISFPASLLQPGPLDMSNLAINIFQQSAGMPNSSTPGDCGGSGAMTGGGGYPNGTITFVSVDPASVVVDLDGVNPFTFDGFDISGMHTALRCQ